MITPKADRTMSHFPFESNTIGKALKITEKTLLSIVGAGGKTTLMYTLCSELARAGRCAVATTTTKILPPETGQCDLFIVEKDEGLLLAALKKSARPGSVICAASEMLPNGKLNGLSPDLVHKIAGIDAVDLLVVEADGAARRPLKAPNATEPVIPGRSKLVLAVVGYDAIGKTLSDEVVFRAAIASELTGLPMGAVITSEAVAKLITHPNGIAKGSPADSEILPFVNKVESKEDFDGARKLAELILRNADSRIWRVLAGSAKRNEAAVLAFRGNFAVKP